MAEGAAATEGVDAARESGSADGAQGGEGADAAVPAPLPDLAAARVVALGLVLAKPAAYLREAVIAAHFGTSAAMDAYGVAIPVAQAAWSVIGTPLQRILVPVLVRARRQRGEAGLAATSGAVLWVALAASAALGLAMLALAAPLAAAYAPAGSLRAAISGMLRWLSPLPLALTLSAYATGWLQARQRFTLPAFTGPPLDLAVIGFVLFAGRHGALTLAWGFLIGTGLQSVLQWPGLFHHRFRAPRPASARQALGDPGVAAAAGMALPLLVSAGAQQGVTLLQNALATRLGVGNVAALTYAMRVLDLPAALFALPVVTVALPHFSGLAAAARPREAWAALRRSAGLLLAALVPCALLILLLRRDLASAIFEHGAFGVVSVGITAGALAGFAPFVVTFGLQELLRAYFYGRQDVRTPMGWDLLALGVAAACDFVLAPHLRQTGLALGASAGSLVGMTGMWWSATRGAAGAAIRAPAEGQRAVWWPLALATAALVVAVALAGHALPLHAAPVHRPWLLASARLAVAGVAGLAAYVAVFAAAGGDSVLRELAGLARPPSSRRA